MLWDPQCTQTNQQRDDWEAAVGLLVGAASGPELGNCRSGPEIVVATPILHLFVTTFTGKYI